MSSSKHPVTTYFSDRADVYARFRPDYPDAAAQVVLEGLDPPVRVADVGCGTGISTRWLARNGAAVVGVEPNQAMRDEARRTSPPGVEYREGTAEATGLEAGSFDLITCAQAFHWFHPESALREFHRLLRPGGRVALLWNVRDTTTPFGAAYAKVVGRAQDAARGSGRLVRRNRAADPGSTGLFHRITKRRVPNSVDLTWEELKGRAQSASYFPAEGALRDELTEVLRVAFEENQRDGRITFAQHTELTLAERVEER